MDIRTKEVNNVVVVYPPERLDIEVFPKFKNLMAELVTTKEAHILLNMSSVKYINSSNIGEIISALRSLDEGKRKLALCGITEKVLEIFNVVNILKLFSVFPSEEDALEQISG